MPTMVCTARSTLQVLTAICNDGMCHFWL